MDSERPTDPTQLGITHDDLLAYLVGAVQRIEAQLASDNPPTWAEKLFEELKAVRSNCIVHKGNGKHLEL